MISWRESANDYKLIGADLQFMTGNRTSSFFGEAYVRGAGVIWRIVAGEFAAFSCETRDVSEISSQPCDYAALRDSSELKAA
jgi:hypothetical protein